MRVYPTMNRIYYMYFNDNKQTIHAIHNTMPELGKNELKIEQNKNQRLGKYEYKVWDSHLKLKNVK